MPKKVFEYKNFKDTKDIWYTESLKGWFIVKENNLYVLRKGCIINDSIEFAMKRYNSYLRLGDAKTGLERKLKEKIESILQQQILFNKLKSESNFVEDKTLDYVKLDKEAERLKAKWGLK